jgi:hypothetical protein
MSSRYALAAALCGLLALASESARAAERPAEPPREPTRHGADCQLCFEGASGMELAVPLWLPIVGLEGLSEGGGQTIKFEPQLEFAIVAEARLRLGLIGISASANGVSLGSQVVHSATGETLGTVELDAYFGRATLDFRPPPYRLAAGARSVLVALWPYMGARYALLAGTGSTHDGSLIFDGETSWIEPLYGLEIPIDLRRGWLFRIRGDVGGFGLGSELSLWGAAEAQYAVTDWLNFHVGYTVYYSRFPYAQGDAKLLLQGPGAGFGLPLF